MKTYMFLVSLFMGSFCSSIASAAAANTYVDPLQETVRMQPFTVQAAGLDIRVVYYTPNGRTIPLVLAVVVTHVVPGSRAEKTGIVPGNRIHRIQKMDVKNLTKDDFFGKVMAQRVSEEFVLEISQENGGPRRQVSIPQSKPVKPAIGVTVASLNN